MNGRPAVFIDRDGTLNVAPVAGGVPQSSADISQFRLYEDVPEGCRMLHRAGYALVVATNQPNVGRGLQSRESVEAIHRRLLELLPEIERIEVSYDAADSPEAVRRKPNPGMLLDAAKDLDIDLASSWMIGDRWRDIDCGAQAGVRTVFIQRGYAEPLRSIPDFTVGSFGAAVEAILEAGKRQ